LSESNKEKFISKLEDSIQGTALTARTSITPTRITCSQCVALVLVSSGSTVHGRRLQPGSLADEVLSSKPLKHCCASTFHCLGSTSGSSTEMVRRGLPRG
ncbi:unnamed protein product, partial [Ascophyllum nodosum]